MCVERKVVKFIIVDIFIYIMRCSFHKIKFIMCSFLFEDITKHHDNLFIFVAYYVHVIADRFGFFPIPLIKKTHFLLCLMHTIIARKKCIFVYTNGVIFSSTCKCMEQICFLKLLYFSMSCRRMKSK